jgi:transaldolase
METLTAYRDHGQPAARLEDNIDIAHNTLSGLGEVGLDLDSLTYQLEREGVTKFTTAYTTLFDNLRQRLR